MMVFDKVEFSPKCSATNVTQYHIISLDILNFIAYICSVIIWRIPLCSSESNPPVKINTCKSSKITARFGAANVGNCGRGAHSPFLLSGLIKCKNCGHKWLGYTVNGKKHKDGTKSKTLYYACGGYVMKGKSVCPRHVVRKEFLEEWVIQKIEEMLKEYFGTLEGLAKVRGMIAEEIKTSSEEIEKESAFLDEETQKIKRTINNLIENISSTNKEFVDQRLVELKRELTALESKKREIEEAKNKQNEVSRMIEQAKELANDFQNAFTSGTVEQKKLFIRAFVKGITLDPVGGTGEGVFVVMPGAGVTKAISIE